MTASVCINNAGAEYFFVLNFIEFKLSRVSEMLKNLTIFIGNCNFHLFILQSFFGTLVFMTIFFAACFALLIITAACNIISSGN